MSKYCEIVAKTDVGRQRFRNEDNFLILEEFSLVAVADGMGGHIDGDVASQIAVDTIKNLYEKDYTTTIEGFLAQYEAELEDKIAQKRETISEDISEAEREKQLEEFAYHCEQEREEKLLKKLEGFLVDAIHEANYNIFEKNKGAFSLEGMGTTIVVLQIIPGYAISACVGDSRIYRVRNGNLSQVTQDHSLVGELVRYNIIGERDILFWQNKNIITRALGMTQSVTVDTAIQKVEKGDVFLLCTDGLTDLVTNREIKETIQNDSSLHDIVDDLIDQANENGGQDNITTAVVEILE